MSDVKVEREQTLSRQEAAVWLSALSEAFARGGHAKLPVGRAAVDSPASTEDATAGT